MKLRAKALIILLPCLVTTGILGLVILMILEEITAASTSGNASSLDVLKEVITTATTEKPNEHIQAVDTSESEFRKTTPKTNTKSTLKEIEYLKIVKEIYEWEFDIYKLHEITYGHSLKFIAKELFAQHDLLQKFKISPEKFEHFLVGMERGYSKFKVPYHNVLHAADITRTVHFILESSGIMNLLSDLEIFEILFAAIIHDFEHNGRTNNFHRNAKTDLALIYNDKSPLENHHLSAAFRSLQSEDKNILKNLTPEQFNQFRKAVIQMVLLTDGDAHAAQLNSVRNFIGQPKNETNLNKETKSMILSFILHTADISNPAKPWKTSKRFAEAIISEFFLQGDEEFTLGLPLCSLCDRNSVHLPESQIGFTNFVVEPALVLLGELIDFLVDKKMIGLESASVANQGKLRPWIKNLKENRANWELIIAERDNKTME